MKTIANDEELIMSKDILLKEMNSGSSYSEVKKLTRTEMINELLSAKESAMTVKFHKKVDEPWVKQVLSKRTGCFNAAKAIVAGEMKEMVCALASKDLNLGRSLVFDLNAPEGKNFRQVDLRTIEELILKNKKYVLK